MSNLTNLDLKKVIGRGYYGIGSYLLNDRSISINGQTCDFNIETLEDAHHLLPPIKEKGIISSLISEMRTDDVFLDIGAHIGIYSCFIGNIIADGNLTSIEPHPENAKSLEKNLKKNSINGSIYQIALSDENGETMLDASGQSGNSGHITDHDNFEGIKVEQFSGEDLISQQDIEPPTVIKIDVEGAELNVLKGLGDILNDTRLIYCEVHPESMPRYGHSEEELRDYFSNSSFSTEINKIPGDPTRYNLKAEK